MALTKSSFAVAGALTALIATSAAAETLFEVEHARAVARSGRPVSEHDVELLERWGATTGSRGWYDRQGETVEIYIDEPPRRHRHRRYHYYRD